MRIHSLRLEPHGRDVRAVAAVEWEEAARPSVDVWFETPAEFAEDFRADPNAFLIASLIPAMRHGEKRIALEGPVCPQLVDGLRSAMELFREWHGESRRPLRIESASGERASEARSPAHAAFFLSGGVDSLHLLRTNRAQLPLSHPGSFRTALFVYGRDFPGAEESAESRNFLDRSRENLAPLARESGFEIVPIGSNARQLDSDHGFFLLEYFGSFLVAAAATLSRRWSSVSLASSWDIGHLRPWGSHPLLDPCFASAAMAVRHEGAGRTRLEKLFELSEWEPAIRRLAVCNHAPGGAWLNCGRCGKCLLTLSALFLAGRIETATSFPPGSLTPQAIRSLSVDGDFADLWRQRLEPLRASGDTEMVRVVEEKIREGDRHRRWAARRGWKGRVRQFDDQFLGGRLRRVIRGA